MNIKKFIGKIIATTLSLVSLTIISPTYAMVNMEQLKAHQALSLGEESLKKSREVIDKANKELTREDLNEKILEFKKLGAETPRKQFDISDDVILNVDPLVLYIYLDVINSFFKKYPNIRSRFMKLTGNEFSIFASHNTTIPINQRPPLRYLAGISGSDIELDIEYGQIAPYKTYRLTLERIREKRIPQIKISVYNVIAYLIAHELGHLFEQLIITDMFANHFPDALAKLCDYEKDFITLQSSPDKASPEMYKLAQKIKSNETAKEFFIRQTQLMGEFVRIGISKQISPVFVSIYGQSNSFDWFAEAFSHALLCDGAPNDIDKAVLDMLDQAEKDFAQAL